MAEKLTGAQQRRVDELHQFIRAVEHVKKLVAELDSNRAARAKIIDNLCGSIARELSQLRQRALTTNVGTVADTAGALAVLAARTGGGLAMKIRGLTEGVHSLVMQLDQALKQALHPETKES
ncbi:MAG: hypothetical protein ACREMJ_02615 [Gemmatimonadales bacterium]